MRDRDILRRCLGYLRPDLPLVGGIYAAMLLINLINVAIPQLIRRGIDDGINAGNLRLLGGLVLLLLGGVAVKGVLLFVQGQWTEIVSQQVAYTLRHDLLHQLTRLSFTFHDRIEAGQLLSRAIQDVERVRFLTGRAVLRLVEGSVLALMTAAVLLWMDVRLGLLVITTMPLVAYAAFRFARLYRPLSLKIQDQLGDLTTRIEQNLRGAQIVKAFAQEEAEIRRFEQENEEWFGLAGESARLQAINAPLLDLIANLGTVAILWLGGYLVMNAQLTLGELVAFTTYLATLIRPIRLIGRIVPILSIAASAGERIFAILDAKPDVQSAPEARPLPEIRGHVAFEQVSFTYENGVKVLKEISFAAEPGQIVALIGATGSGKSSLINLVARFYDPTGGRILVDGHDARTVALRSLRRQTGLVMQDSVLFAATVRENLTFGRPDATEAEIVQAAKDAQAHDFIEAMPFGYDTPVGERGVTLSGGQKQRLAIARALITDPRILILDDATASVDSRTEQRIQKALNRLMQGRTTFVIAHRLSTVRRADLILVLEDGRITARGTHAELLATSPLYRRVHELQLRPAEMAGLREDA